MSKGAEIRWNDFIISEPMFKIFAILASVWNSLQNPYYITHLTLGMLLHCPGEYKFKFSPDIHTGSISLFIINIINIITAEHHRTCQVTAPRSPVLIGGICIPPTVNCLHLANRSTLTAVRPFQLPTPVWNTLPNFIRDPTISSDCFRRLLKTFLFARSILVLSAR